MTQVFLEAMEGWLFELVQQLPVLAWLKRSSLSFEHSLDTLTAARLRWAARRSSLCSLSSLDRLTKFPATFARRWQNRPIPDEENTHNLQTSPGQTKSDLERSALRATVLRTSLSPTFPDKQSPTSNGQRSALRATVLRTSLSPTRPDKQSPPSNARRCAPR